MWVILSWPLALDIGTFYIREGETISVGRWDGREKRDRYILTVIIIQQQTSLTFGDTLSRPNYFYMLMFTGLR